MLDAVAFLIGCTVGTGNSESCLAQAYAQAGPPAAVVPSLVPNTPMPEWTSSIEIGPTAASGVVPTS